MGREQNSKYHARIAVAPILGQWLTAWEPLSASGHYLAHRGQPIESKNFFKRYIADSGIPDCVPYTLRHTVASWLSGHGVPKWERSRFMGHSRPDGNTTDTYSHYDPVYLRAAANAIQKLFEAIAPYTQVDLLRHTWEDQPCAPDHGQGAWLDRFLVNDGHRLVGLFEPQAPPRRVPSLTVISGEGADPNPALAGTDSDQLRTTLVPRSHS